MYNFKTTEVLAVYENTSEELLQIFEDFCDSFRNCSLNSDSRYTSSPSNNVYANLIQQRFKQTIISAKVRVSYSIVIYATFGLASWPTNVYKMTPFHAKILTIQQKNVRVLLRSTLIFCDQAFGQTTPYRNHLL